MRLDAKILAVAVLAAHLAAAGAGAVGERDGGAVVGPADVVASVTPEGGLLVKAAPPGRVEARDGSDGSGICGGFAPLVTRCTTPDARCGDWYNCYPFFQFAFPPCAQSTGARSIPTPCYSGVVENRVFSDSGNLGMRCHVLWPRYVDVQLQCDWFGYPPNTGVVSHECRSLPYRARGEPDPIGAEGGVGEWLCGYHG